MNNKISIIIPIYNVELYLKRCIDTVLNQDIDKSEYEIILVNDGSTDSSGNIAKKYYEQYDNIIYVTQKNKGISEARNIGIRIASGKYIWFIDSDDYIQHNCLGTILSLLTKNDLDILFFRSQPTSALEYDFKEVKLSSDSILETITGIEYVERTNYKNFVTLCIFKRDFILGNNLLFEAGRLWEDGMYLLDALYATDKISYYPERIYYYFHNTSSVSNTRNEERYIKAIQDLIFIIDYFQNFINKVKGTVSDKYIDRITTRKDSYVFFLNIRLIKSKIGNREIKEIRNSLKLKGHLPITNFISSDYNSLSYKIILPIINNDTLFNMALHFRKLKI